MEEKEQKFACLANVRVNAAIKSLERIAKLSKYAHTQRAANVIVAALEKKIEEVKKRLEVPEEERKFDIFDFLMSAAEAVGEEFYANQGEEE